MSQQPHASALVPSPPCHVFPTVPWLPYQDKTQALPLTDTGIDGMELRFLRT